jgi:hypothetical protein
VSRIFSSPRSRDLLWSPPIPGDNVAGAWSWPLASSYCRGQENEDLTVHSPTPSWRRASLVKHRDNFTLPYLTSPQMFGNHSKETVSYWLKIIRLNVLRFSALDYDYQKWNTRVLLVTCLFLPKINSSVLEI